MSATLNMSSFAASANRRIQINGLHSPSWRALRISKIGLTMNNSFQARLRSTAEAMPKIAQASTWQSIIPKFLRSGGSSTSPRTKSKEWNPATFYVVIWTLIGSQAIQMLVLRKDFENYTRKADAKIRLLREVIQKVNNGENVDVERLLGTGDEVKEREWEEVLQEIENEDSVWRQKSHDHQRNDESSSSTPGDIMDKPRDSVVKSEKFPQASTVPANEVSKTARFY
ncbi:conserved hypothetical protein [Talaromyces stipitatus ATCC 10500]|uniref:Uncharacterized protein n=1 Tax=Talaromyces stipitatus (strain ATCC 10500 / CBS 375.48 / QM 6759 / NRRL 1006) TaxID=441959 RepID=B8MFN1_TALSN|nr:uncharacterized protein TSTA_020780 [Talaromyces stipitatus ATCC 10500]EED17021.1 conserved hypothetical protein [Talaromyces stipitatus ATCC 10500]